LPAGLGHQVVGALAGLADDGRGLVVRLLAKLVGDGLGGDAGERTRRLGRERVGLLVAFPLHGRGAAQLDGKMIDAASARMAQNVVDTALAIEGRGMSSRA
jgi:hypothetical protein